MGKLEHLEHLEHTLENSIKAKEYLESKHGMKFIKATPTDVELGYLLGEYLIIIDEFAKTAIEIYNEKVFWENHEDSYIDHMMSNLYQ
jgi:hypothetical protein